MKKVITFLFVISLLGVGGYFGWQKYKDYEIEQRVQKEVAALEAAMDSAIKIDSSSTDSSGAVPNLPGEANAFNLEKTVRMLRIMNDGYAKAGSMEKYMDFLSKQDYRGIPKEVIEAKKKILPLYANIRIAEEKMERTKNENFWKSLVNAENLFSDKSPIGSIVVRLFREDLSSTDALPQLINKVIIASKELYQNMEDFDGLEEEARKALRESKGAYTEYMYEFTPILVKYLTEWDRVCNLRDQAYLAIRNEDNMSALASLNSILKDYPNDRESMLLKSYSLLVEMQKNPERSKELGYAEDVRQLLKNYMTIYPLQSAPAYVLLGSLDLLEGREASAKSFYDKASQEYPRQAEALKDMYSSYKYRSYMSKSKEGSYVTEMYKATMEGFGFFSPNFQKAIFAYNKGDIEQAKEEILMHFFRRGNQDFYDYMISDMVYVERSMPEIFDMIFHEHGYLDLKAYNPTLSFSDKLAIEVENRSDRKISNVRLFVCLHLTDMYKDDYVVHKVSTTVNNILPHSKADFGKIQLDYDLMGKKKNKVSDIVSARAILVTDDVIIWVDQDSVKMNSVTDNLRKKGKFGKSNVFDTKKSFGFDGKRVMGVDVVNEINDQVTFDVKKVNVVTGLFTGDNFVLHFPRIIDCINPYFSFGPLGKKETFMPTSVLLNGNTVDVEFRYNSDFKGKTVPLYVTTEYGSFSLDVTFDEKAVPAKIGKVKL